MEETLEPSVENTESTGLLDGATPEVEEANAENPQATEIDHRDPEQVKAAEGALDEPQEIPDWWPENFINKETGKQDVEGMAKSWKDLRKQISQGKHKAPADGVYDTSAFGDVPENDPIRSHVMGWAKQYQVSQAALDDLVGQVVGMQREQAENYNINVQEEKKMLGPNADARIQGMVKWGSNLVQKGIWSKDDFEEFKIMGGTARGIAALEKLRSSYEGRLPVETTPVEGAPTMADVHEMMADPQYQTNANFRAKVERMIQQIVPN